MNLYKIYGKIYNYRINHVGTAMKRTFRKTLSLMLAVTLVFGTVAFDFSDVDWSEIDWHDFAIYRLGCA